MYPCLQCPLYAKGATHLPSCGMVRKHAATYPAILPTVPNRILLYLCVRVVLVHNSVLFMAHLRPKDACTKAVIWHHRYCNRITSKRSSNTVSHSVCRKPSSSGRKGWQGRFVRRRRTVPCSLQWRVHVQQQGFRGTCLIPENSYSNIS